MSSTRKKIMSITSRIVIFAERDIPMLNERKSKVLLRKIPRRNDHYVSTLPSVGFAAVVLHSPRICLVHLQWQLHSQPHSLRLQLQLQHPNQPTNPSHPRWRRSSILKPRFLWLWFNWMAWYVPVYVYQVPFNAYCKGCDKNHQTCSGGSFYYSPWIIARA